MPKKVNQIHQKVLSALTETKTVKTKTKRIENGEEFETSREAQILRFPLAGNVSEENVKRLIGEVV